MTELPIAEPRFATVMVSVDLGIGTETRVITAAAVASRFSALLIGVAACSPLVSGDITFEEEEDRIRQSLADAEGIFRKAAAGTVEWRSGIDEPDAFLVRQVAAADLLIVGRQGTGDPTGGRMGVKPGSVVARAGRPILILPTWDERSSARRVLVAWKDTPEARRSVADSLPMLANADEVIVLTVGEDTGNVGLGDICGFIERHGVPAVAVHQACSAGSVGQRIVEQAVTRGIDLIVAGAYGRGRLREWAFGGVTTELLHHTPCPCLLSR